MSSHKEHSANNRNETHSHFQNEEQIRNLHLIRSLNPRVDSPNSKADTPYNPARPDSGYTRSTAADAGRKVTAAEPSRGGYCPNRDPVAC